VLFLFSKSGLLYILIQIVLLAVEIAQVQ